MLVHGNRIMDSTLNKQQVGTVDTAILLASSGVFDVAGPLDGTRVSALTRISGLTLFQRTIFTLQLGGISQILALVGKEEQALRALVQTDNRIRAAIRWLPIREFPPSDPHTWEILGSEVKEPCLILGCHMVFSPSLIETLREEERDGQVAIAIGQEGHYGRMANPGILMRTDPRPDGLSPRIVFHDPIHDSSESRTEGAEGFAPAADLVVLPSRLLGISGSWTAPQVGPIRLALEQAAAEGIVHTVSASSHHFLDTRVLNGRRLAERTLHRALQTVKGGLDGFVDRYFNRKLSGVFTRLFMWLGLSPNAITILSMCVGLVAAWCFGQGQYSVAILGALLFQLSVVIDCCDGEVARLTFAESPFGQELDIIADNVVHMAIFAGIAWGACQQGPWAHDPLPLILGAITVVANGLSLLLVNRVRHLRGNLLQWGRLSEKQRTRLEFILGNVASRDFSVVVLLCAVVQILPWFLAVAALGSSFFVLAMVWILLGSIRPSD